MIKLNKWFNYKNYRKVGYLGILIITIKLIFYANDITIPKSSFQMFYVFVCVAWLIILPASKIYYDSINPNVTKINKASLEKVKANNEDLTPLMFLFFIVWLCYV